MFKKSLICLAALASLQAQAQPQRTIPTVTRSVQQFSLLENQLLDAVSHRNAEALNKVVSEDFELRSAAAPGRPTARAEWQQQAFAGKPLESSIEQMAVHEIGELAMVSFLWKIDAPKDAGVAQQVFVVDTWKQTDNGWKAIIRYAAPVDASAKPVPGSDAAAPAIRKKY